MSELFVERSISQSRALLLFNGMQIIGDVNDICKVGSSKESQACTTSNNGNIYTMSPLYIFALTSMSFSDLLFLKEMIGDSLKICCRDGWFCIRCHFPIKTCLSFGTAGWYCVTKGKISFRLSLFCCRADVLSVNLTSDKSVSIRRFG